MVLIYRRCLLWCGIGRLSYRGCLGVDVKAGDCFPNISFVQVIARVRMVFLCLRLVFCRHSRAHSIRLRRTHSRHDQRCIVP